MTARRKTALAGLAALLIGMAPVTGPMTGPARAEAPPPPVPETLMLTLEDMIAVERAIAAGPLARRARGDRDADYRLRGPLYLSAIVYGGPEDWAVWINGTRYTPQHTPEDYALIEVTRRGIRLRVPWGKDQTRTVRLAPHQTFVPSIGSVIEGRFH